VQFVFKDYTFFRISGFVNVNFVNLWNYVFNSFSSPLFSDHLLAIRRMFQYVFSAHGNIPIVLSKLGNLQCKILDFWVWMAID